MDLGQTIYVGGVRLSFFRGNINVQDVQFLGQRSDGGGEAVGAAEAAGHHVPDDDPDLPF